MQKKILVVDDELLIAQGWKMCLELEGFVVDFVLGVKEAIKKIEEREYDLIITDLKMPELDGEVLLQYLQESKLPSKVIISSGHIGNDDHLEKYEFEKIVEKPFNIEHEIEAIKELLKD
ncbi:response regulator [Reichenbachiella ulvae]|uniref:Response regulator n=1 Tax=Reichenbachiella ulvae TaxID=2980104 RepID=A0ABT3CR66_9BACT|nr:response regulator [Reichenbachiella ulvae]MCV9386178.1 response regulator [Reichenbachiella ulvae]